MFSQLLECFSIRLTTLQLVTGWLFADSKLQCQCPNHFGWYCWWKKSGKPPEMYKTLYIMVETTNLKWWLNAGFLVAINSRDGTVWRNQITKSIHKTDPGWSWNVKFNMLVRTWCHGDNTMRSFCVNPTNKELHKRPITWNNTSGLLDISSAKWKTWFTWKWYVFFLLFLVHLFGEASGKTPRCFKLRIPPRSGKFDSAEVLLTLFCTVFGIMPPGRSKKNLRGDVDLGDLMLGPSTRRHV